MATEGTMDAQQDAQQDEPRDAPQSASVQEAGGTDWSGLVAGRTLVSGDGRPLERLARPVVSPGLVVMPTRIETFDLLPYNGPVAFVEGSWVTMATLEEGEATLARGGKGIAGALRHYLAPLEFAKPKEQVHESCTRREGDERLNKLLGVNAHGTLTGLKTIFTANPKALLVQDARGLEAGQPVRRILRVLAYPQEGMVVTCGNLAGGAEVVTIDSVSGADDAIRRLVAIVDAVRPDAANQAQADFEAGRRGVRRLFPNGLDLKTILWVLAIVLLAVVVGGPSVVAGMDSPPQWLVGLVGSQVLRVAAALALVLGFGVGSGVFGGGRDR